MNIEETAVLVSAVKKPNNFQKNLAAAKANLERLEQLAAEAPDLLSYADCGIYVESSNVRAILCDSSMSRTAWVELAGKYKSANWKITDSKTWDGNLNGVRLTILIEDKDREIVPKPKPLFEEPAHEETRAA